MAAGFPPAVQVELTVDPSSRRPDPFGVTSASSRMKCRTGAPHPRSAPHGEFAWSHLAITWIGCQSPKTFSLFVVTVSSAEKFSPGLLTLHALSGSFECLPEHLIGNLPCCPAFRAELAGGALLGVRNSRDD